MYANVFCFSVRVSSSLGDICVVVVVFGDVCIVVVVVVVVVVGGGVVVVVVGISLQLFISNRAICSLRNFVVKLATMKLVKGLSSSENCMIVA